MLVEITFEEIYDVWRNQLWTARSSPIKANSAMNFLGGHSLHNLLMPATFFGYKDGDKLVGVNSGHLCQDGSYRSRGLYVHYDYRRQGIGTKLLLMTIEQAQREQAKFIWSYPKKSSWRTYAAAGFELAGPWHDTELDVNAYCVKYLNR